MRLCTLGVFDHGQGESPSPDSAANFEVYKKVECQLKFFPICFKKISVNF
jgi:hypothetical protein